MKGFKAFNKDMKCRNFQFEENQIYKHQGRIQVCDSGFHFCENPLDTLDYYDLCDSEFAEVEATGKTKTGGNKTVTDEIKIGVKLGLKGFIDAAFSFLWEKCKTETMPASGDSSKLAASGDYSKLAASGDSSKLAASGHSSQLAASGHYSKLAASGDSSKLAASGDSSKLAASGDSSKLAMTGQNSVGAAIGIDNKIKGALGDWVTLAEWEYDEKKQKYIPVCVKSAKIDGKKLKADTWYKLEGKKFVECEN